MKLNTTKFAIFMSALLYLISPPVMALYMIPTVTIDGKIVDEETAREIVYGDMLASDFDEILVERGGTDRVPKRVKMKIGQVVHIFADNLNSDHLSLQYLESKFNRTLVCGDEIPSIEDSVLPNNTTNDHAALGISEGFSYLAVVFNSSVNIDEFQSGDFVLFTCGDSQ